MGSVKRMMVGVAWGILASAGMGLGLGGTAVARGDAPLPRATCVKLALEKRALDKGDVRRYLAMTPQKVASEFGKPVIERVRHYIALREKVLFQCPPHVLNENVGPQARRANVMPPLPVKGPVRARLRQPKRPLVPLPVKRQS